MWQKNLAEAIGGGRSPQKFESEKAQVNLGPGCCRVCAFVRRINAHYDGAYGLDFGMDLNVLEIFIFYLHLTFLTACEKKCLPSTQSDYSLSLVGSCLCPQLLPQMLSPPGASGSVALLFAWAQR